jgi:hypothetical protein
LFAAGIWIDRTEEYKKRFRPFRPVASYMGADEPYNHYTMIIEDTRTPGKLFKTAIGRCNITAYEWAPGAWKTRQGPVLYCYWDCQKAGIEWPGGFSSHDDKGVTVKQIMEYAKLLYGPGGRYGADEGRLEQVREKIACRLRPIMCFGETHRFGPVR